jgi:hypothetical protein
MLMATITTLPQPCAGHQDVAICKGAKMKARLLAIAILVAILSLGFVLAVSAQGGASGWIQVNTNGFGNAQNKSIGSLTPFGGDLYAGTFNSSGTGAQLWHTSTGSNWTAVITNGFGITPNFGIDHLLSYNGQLYAGVANDVTGGEVWRSVNGLDWTQVISQGFGDSTNGEVVRFTVFGDILYASTASYTTTHGGEIWRTSTGNNGDWTRVVTNGFNGDFGNVMAISFGSFSGYLYAGTSNSTTGGEAWRTSNGITWTQVNTDGFGTANNPAVSALASFNGYLYASTRGKSGVSGAQVWRCQVCDGSDWTKTVDNGFGNINARLSSALEAFNSRLYFVVGNASTGMEVWQTVDGTNWQQVGFAGFGDSHNTQPDWDNSVVVFDNYLFIGTANSTNGGQIWLYLPNQVYLPVVIRQ